MSIFCANQDRHGAHGTQSLIRPPGPKNRLSGCGLAIGVSQADWMEPRAASLCLGLEAVAVVTGEGEKHDGKRRCNEG